MPKSKQMFVGIDTSKDSHQLSFLNPTEVKKDLRTQNNREVFDQLTNRLESYRSRGYNLKVACEPTGHYWENLGRHLKERGLTVEIVHPFIPAAIKR